ncbi:unnamed protein product [Prunus armeniaca]|uniref:Neprosin PEP catalytic domain-containing protein n=1 Tax=Prunus armeniaca TaxID=36596 RepID=A0A6J5YAD5_PRUAR|nr:unnamed protein product [Prunus armeniaca]
MSAPTEEALELERELQSLNNPPVKTIQLDGDIIDCADINHQPALDHPLLKNHKIQLRPTSIPATQTKKSVLVNKPLQAGFMQAGCPNGTVPIYRTTKEYLTRAKSLSHQMFSNISQINDIAPNVHVSPSINGDSEPRLFIYWTLNADKTGCFNSFCQRFVQVDRDIGPKTRFDPVSSFGGTTYDSKFAIYQDSIPKNWWLVVSEKDVAIGYWPKELVPSLEIGAGDVGWGGIAMAQENENAPPVGSGQYPDGTYQHVGYFRDIHFMKDGLHPKVPTDADPVFEYAEVPCYADPVFEYTLLESSARPEDQHSSDLHNIEMLLLLWLAGWVRCADRQSTSSFAVRERGLHSEFLKASIVVEDTQTSNWWLAVTDRNITVGYWPKKMLPHLRNGAGEVGWGGTAMAATKRSPPIGSGQYPDDNYDRAAYFRNPHFIRVWLKEVVPSETDPVYEYTGQSGCYGLENGKDTKVEFWGYRFAYGGPGGECGP